MKMNEDNFCIRRWCHGKEKMNKRVLNVGCGEDKYGTDFLDIYPNRREVIKCDVGKEKFPYKDETFDEVYSKNLFEHIANLPHLLDEMKRVLKRKGKIKILTDNAGFFLFHIPIRKNNFLQHNSNSVRGGKEDRHYFLFTPLHLRNHLERLGGFNNISVKYSYVSERKIIKVLKPFFKLLNKTFLVRLINPDIVLEGYKDE